MKEKPAVRFDWTNGYGAAVFIKPAPWSCEMIEGGKVHYNGQRSKPSKIVELNATLHSCAREMTNAR